MEETREINNNSICNNLSVHTRRKRSSLTLPENKKPVIETLSKATEYILKCIAQHRGSALENALMEIVVISCTWFFPYFPLFLIYASEFILLFLRTIHSLDLAIKGVEELWIGYMCLWHQHKIVGLENIPSMGPGIEFIS